MTNLKKSSVALLIFATVIFLNQVVMANSHVIFDVRAINVTHNPKGGWTNSVFVSPGNEVLFLVGINNLSNNNTLKNVHLRVHYPKELFHVLNLTKLFHGKWQTVLDNTIYAKGVHLLDLGPTSNYYVTTKVLVGTTNTKKLNITFRLLDSDGINLSRDMTLNLLKVGVAPSMKIGISSKFRPSIIAIFSKLTSFFHALKEYFLKNPTFTPKPSQKEALKEFNFIKIEINNSIRITFAISIGALYWILRKQRQRRNIEKES